ncbi:cytochrome b/b6 domain-containing protein [Paracoccaceae bacterium Fryx2]|nr:cytochrome b/b6 domain-containing protein [Paracoccaceae bacterium Fryx2]
MTLTNTPRSYGSLARSLHWLTALLILTAIALGLIANELPYDTAEALAFKAQLFSLHKTLGIATFGVALLRILWALTQPRPAPMHPGRRLESLAAEATHWLLYLSLVLVPLSGWVHHAATTGFAPILWPFGQSLPFVPKSETLAQSAGALHWLFTKLLIAAILLHIAGALKHALIDRDGTLSRMLRGTPGGTPARHATAPAFLALLIYALGAGAALTLVPQDAPPATPVTATATDTAGNWQVTDGSLTFTVRQMGAEVQGSFATWSADITFDETPANGENGRVTVTIATDSLTLGSVTAQAKAPEFFDTAAHPQATFAATLRPAPEGYTADGALNLRGTPQPVSLPFTLTIDDGTARMQGSTTLDRRTFGMGPSYPDEASVGHFVTVTVDLTAIRQP